MPMGMINVSSKDLEWSKSREVGRGFLSQRRDDLDPIPLEQISRIRSLLRKKRNPSYIRILITSDCGTVVMDMLSKLLANLAEDQLIELHYGNRGLLSTNKLLLGTENCFPTLKQMELIWARQRKLHQTYHSKHIPTMFKALEKITLEQVLFFVLSRNWFWLRNNSTLIRMTWWHGH